MVLSSNRAGKHFLRFALIVLLFLNLIGLGLGIYNLFSFSVDVAQYIYAFAGAFVVPIEFLITGKVGFLCEKENSYFAFVFLMIAVFVIVTLIALGRFFNEMLPNPRRRAGRIFALICSSFIFAYSIFSAVIFTLNSKVIGNLLNDISPKFIISLTTALGGINFTGLFGMIVAYLIGAFALIGFVLLAISKKQKHQKEEVKEFVGVTFYTSDLMPKQESEAVQESQDLPSEELEIKNLKESDPKAQKLVNKIRILDELRKDGKISTPEYTRLRQSAIRRYRK